MQISEQKKKNACCPQHIYPLNTSQRKPHQSGKRWQKPKEALGFGQQMMCSPKRSAAALKPKEGKPGLESGSGCRVPVPWAHGSQHCMREKHWVRGQPGSLIRLPSFFSLEFYASRAFSPSSWQILLFCTHPSEGRSWSALCWDSAEQSARGMGQEMGVAMETHPSASSLCLSFDTSLKQPGLTFINRQQLWVFTHGILTLYPFESLLCLSRNCENFHS